MRRSSKESFCCVIDVLKLTKLKVLVKNYHRRERMKKEREREGFIRWYDNNNIRKIEMSSKWFRVLDRAV